MRFKTTSMLMLGAALTLAAPVAHAMDPIPADEMSSPEWLDCAGHFFFLADRLRQSGDEQLAKRFNGMALMAVYASEEKSKAERKAGQTSNGRGKSLVDPKTGQLQVETAAMVKDHAGKAQAQGQNAYVEGYAAKCGAPVTAFTKRFSAIAMPAK